LVAGTAALLALVNTGTWTGGPVMESDAVGPDCATM
jgi:hypothetical protein